MIGRNAGVRYPKQTSNLRRNALGEGQRSSYQKQALQHMHALPGGLSDRLLTGGAV